MTTKDDRSDCTATPATEATRTSRKRAAMDAPAGWEDAPETAAAPEPKMARTDKHQTHEHVRSRRTPPRAPTGKRTKRRSIS